MKRKKELEAQPLLHYIVVGKSAKGKAIRRVYPFTPKGKKEAEQDAERARKRGGRNIDIVEA